MDVLSDNDLRDLLDREAARINSPDFIADDPVQFPRRFGRLQDIEIVALLSATIAWGNRKMICNDCEKMLRMMEYRPFDFLRGEAYEELDDGNIHRTFFVGNFRHYLRGLRAIYSRHTSIADFARHINVNADPFPAWKLVEAINAVLYQANGDNDSRCLPLNLRTSALKRVNMALRWLVRDDGIVDMGVWKGVIDKSRLFIPLDVHVGNTARQLGLITRRANDRRSVEDLTRRLRAFRPDDPVIYDYALFGIGIEAKRQPTIINP